MHTLHTTERIRQERGAGVRRITLAEPAGENTLSLELVEALCRALDEAEADASCRALVLAAEGAHFCQGLDLTASAEGDPALLLGVLRSFAKCLLRIHRSRVPVIACVEGRVTGGGVGLVAACDLVLSTESAVFMLSEVIVGMVPAMILPFLLRRITPGRTGYLTLSSRGIGGHEAREIGLVDEVAVDGMAKSLERQLKRLGCSSPEALAESKAFLERLADGELGRQVDMAIDLQISRMARPEVREGLRLFAEGSIPPWFSRIAMIAVDAVEER